MLPPVAPQRIAKLLARAGVASRREIERMIAEGRVAKDGIALDTPATLLPTLAGVTVDGQPVAAPEPARLFLHHKPPGLLVTERDPQSRPTIYDRLPKTLPRVVPVGRLDLGTEGLLLLTTDGALKRQLELPATGVERVYRARAYGQVSQARLEELIEGIEIEGVRYGSIDANLERRTGANVWIELTLTEGKNREVRRVLEHLGLRVSRLIRTRYGPFVLGDLPPGEVGEVRAHDVASFRKNPTRRDLPQPARARGASDAPVAAPAKPLHHRPRRAAGPPPRASSGRIGEGERSATKPNPPRAPLGEENRPAKPGGGGAPGATGKPTRPTPQRASAEKSAKVANPARAARAKAHRDANGRPDPTSPKPGRGVPKARRPRKRP